MTVPVNLQYTDSHEWVRLEVDGVATVGITDHAQEALGDIVQLELPIIGITVVAGTPVATIESVKAASDVHAPVSGEIVEVNSDLAASPEVINAAPYESWLFRIKLGNDDALATLVTAEEYTRAVET